MWGGISQLHGNKELPGGPPSPPRGFMAPKFWRDVCGGGREEEEISHLLCHLALNNFYVTKEAK